MNNSVMLIGYIQNIEEIGAQVRIDLKIHYYEDNTEDIIQILANEHLKERILQDCKIGNLIAVRGKLRIINYPIVVAEKISYLKSNPKEEK